MRFKTFLICLIFFVDNNLPGKFRNLIGYIAKCSKLIF